MYEDVIVVREIAESRKETQTKVDSKIRENQDQNETQVKVHLQLLKLK